MVMASLTSWAGGPRVQALEKSLETPSSSPSPKGSFLLSGSSILSMMRQLMASTGEFPNNFQEI